MVLRDRWWENLPSECVSDLRLIAFADAERGVLMLRPDTCAALEAHAKRDGSAPVCSAVHHVLRQAIRLVMPVLSREGWRTNPLARTIDLLMADASAVFNGQKCGVTTWGEAKRWLPCSPFREAVDVFDRLAMGNLGEFYPIDQTIMDLTSWMMRWYQPREGPRRPLTGPAYVREAFETWVAPVAKEQRCGRQVILEAFQDGVRPGCPIGQGPLEALQPILDALGPEPDEGHIVAAYRRLLEQPQTTDLEIEIFMRCLHLTPSVWAHLGAFDAAYGRTPPALHHTQPPPPPAMRPADRAAYAWVRTGTTRMEVEMEAAYCVRVNEAEEMLKHGGEDAVIEAMREVVTRTPNAYPPSVRLGGRLLVRYWEEADIEARRDAGEFTDADLVDGATIRTVWPRAYFVLACALAQANQFDEANAALDAGESLDGDVIFALERAAICSMRSDRDGAMNIFREVLARPGAIRQAHRACAERGLAVHLIDLGEYREALLGLFRAEEALPEHPATRRELAYLLAQVASGGAISAPIVRTLNTAAPRCASCGDSALGGGTTVFLGSESLYLCGPCRARWTGVAEL